MSERWKPDAFVNTYTRDLHKRIDEKIRRGETKVITEPDSTAEVPRSADVIDLMTLLKRSLGGKNARVAATRAVKTPDPGIASHAKTPRHATSPRPVAARRKRA